MHSAIVSMCTSLNGIRDAMRCDEMDAAAAQHVEREWKLTAILLGDDLSLLPDLTLCIIPASLFSSLPA